MDTKKNPKMKANKSRAALAFNSAKGPFRPATIKYADFPTISLDNYSAVCQLRIEGRTSKKEKHVEAGLENDKLKTL